MARVSHLYNLWLQLHLQPKTFCGHSSPPEFAEVSLRAEELGLLITKAVIASMKSAVVIPECGSHDSPADFPHHPKQCNYKALG